MAERVIADQRVIMVSMLFLLAVTGAVLWGAASIRAAEAVAMARATILAPVTVTGEAVRLTMKSGGGCGLGAACAGPVGVGTVQVSGSGALRYSMTLPGKAAIFSGSDSLTLDQFTALLGAAGTSGKIDARTVLIGAKLHLPADQSVGNYNGTFEVIFEYE